MASGGWSWSEGVGPLSAGLLLRSRRRLVCLLAIVGLVFGAPTVASAQLPEQSPVAPTYRYSAPTGLVAKASAGGSGRIVLKWDSKGSGVHYQVRYVNRWSRASWTKQVIVPSTSISGLWHRTRYYFQVRVVDSKGKAASRWSKAKKATTKKPADAKAKLLRVASYNIRTGVKSGGPSWSSRRKLVADSIKKQRLAVVGLQEAEPQRVASGVSQYRDLLNLLGSHYRIVSTANTAGTRIIYNSKSVSLVRQGNRKLSGDDKPKRYVVWAVFKQKSTGRTFFFANTHLVRGPEGAVKSSGKCSKKVSKYYRMRKSQASQVVAAIRANNTKRLPVVLTGDMNSHKYHCPNNGPYRVYTAAGLVDPIGNPDRSSVPVKATTELRIHTQFDSSNHYKSAPLAHGWVNGSNVDYVWVSKSVTTLEYETVVNINSSGRFVTTPPSDHNMIRATVLIPKA